MLPLSEFTETKFRFYSVGSHIISEWVQTEILLKRHTESENLKNEIVTVKRNSRFYVGVVFFTVLRHCQETRPEAVLKVLSVPPSRCSEFF